MEKNLYDEMTQNISEIQKQILLSQRNIFLFGHCNATIEIVDLLEQNEIKPVAILDNSEAKQKEVYKGVPVCYPKEIMNLAGDNPKEESIVLIASRFYAAMSKQLRCLGYEGPIRKVIDYNTYADYSLDEETIKRMKKREEHGEEILRRLEVKYPSHFKVYFPFNALGDVYLAMSYWPYFAKNRGIEQTVFCVPSRILADVVHLFKDYPVEVYEQKELDAMIQAVIYTRDENSYIAHQDRPYVINLAKALYIKCIPLETMYCCGVFGLPQGTASVKPRTDLPEYKDLDSIPEGKSVIFSPYAKSVIALDDKIWCDAVKYYTDNGYKCYTNVVGDERAIEGTLPISPSLLEMKSVVERAGTFIGIRSGLCDVIREAKAKKIALYPDYYYSDTKWKAIDIYNIEQFDYNILATEEIEWNNL